MSIEELVKVVSYDPATGELRRLMSARNGRAKAGSLATHSDDKGYLRISFKGKQYFAHRVAWYIVHGKYPDGQIDHLNGDGKDNRLSNLRDASPTINSQNKIAAMGSSSSKLLGVYYDRQKNRWRGEIIANKRRHRLGWFKTAEEAHAAYIGAKAVLHPESYIASIADACGKTREDFGDGCVSLGGYARRKQAKEVEVA